MSVLVLSDIHGNLAALGAVLDSVSERTDITGCILLGDLIDYGMHSNEVITVIRQFPYRILCNIWGNHEQAVCLEKYDRFSSERGRECARYTRGQLTDQSWTYLWKKMNREGIFEFELEGKRCLAVHGSGEAYFWKSIDTAGELSQYQEYDYVFSGHSHIPHFTEKYYPVQDEEHRNKKKTIFINPGSVGQPRNHNPRAQFVIADIETEEVMFHKIAYDIKKEQAAFTGQVDLFYKNRLKSGV